ncbi:MAG TPA: hypothetical protein VF209_02565 [Patescibacteria group bacterium]
MHLSALSSATGLMEMVRLDEALKLSEAMGAALDDVGGKQLVQQAIKNLQQAARKDASGLIVDPQYSYPLLKSDQKLPGLAFRLHQQLGSTVDPLAIPSLIQDWGVEAIRNNYGVAFLELHYHPSEADALRKKQIVTELADYCHHEGIDFILSLIVYTPATEEFNSQRFQEAQLTAIQELRAFPQLLALQYPLDPLSAATVTAELDVPWILSDMGLEYEPFKGMLRESLENGAKGFLAGEVIWKDLSKEKDQAALLSPDTIDRYFTTIGRDRILELVRITEEYEEK